jgi:acetyl esterase/lipase
VIRPVSKKTLLTIFGIAAILAVIGVKVFRKKPPTGKPEKNKPRVVEPASAEAAYGPHPKQRLYFWKAPSDRPTPMVLYIHGGAWTEGHYTDGLRPYLKGMLREGISVASIEYRFIAEAIADKVDPPIKAPMHDAARALQFIRSKAAEWNIDKDRIGAAGTSAGGCMGLWLAFHPELADPASSDPVARESTRLWCVAVNDAQTTLDPQLMREWTPNTRYGGHAFGFYKMVKGEQRADFAGFLSQRERLLPSISEYSPYSHVTADDPPTYLFYHGTPAVGKEQADPVHTANFGVKLQERLHAVGGECELVYPGAPAVKHAKALDFLMDKLKAPKP